MLRNPEKRAINPMNAPSLEGLSQQLVSHAITWHTLKCELVTPMYGGGVQSTVVDTKMPIRVASIRGQLRFWWRLLAKNKWKLGDAKAIRKAEFDLWGGMSDGDEDGKASKVLLRITDMPSEKFIKQNLQSYEDIKLPYVLFPAANEINEVLKPHKLLKAEGFAWKLDFAFTNALNEKSEKNEDGKSQVIEALQWWANFGGLGFRSRKGLGAVFISESDDFPQITKTLTTEEVAEANCKLVVKTQTSSDALAMLRIAVEKLSNFRQAENIGRNEGQQHNRPGRSHWSEPDALRVIYNTHACQHRPEHKAGKVFPRAVFGLPIIFHFVGHGEPRDTSLIHEQGERLASPLILRPVFAGLKNNEKKWQPAALLLPYQHILKMQVKINQISYPIWNTDTAQYIKPIQKNGGGDPLQAFLTYFAK